VAALSLFQDPQVDKREFPAEFKMLDDGDPIGSFEGIAAVFSNIDRQNEIIQPGAFQKTLSDFSARGFLANAHDWTEPIGTIDEARETDRGLFVTGKFHSTPHAQLARKVAQERLARGKQVAMSIGYKVTSDEVKDGSRHLHELELYEVSLVTVPANPLASLASVKAVELAEDATEIEARRTEMRRIQLERLAATRV
jgi:hypothetical protein